MRIVGIVIAGLVLFGIGAVFKSKEIGSGGVPLPQASDITRSFLELLAQHRISDAFSLMSQRMTGDESTKQAWAVQFNDLDSLKVVSVERTSEEDLIKVSLAVTVNPRAANAPIPYYGWGENPNIRFIKLVKEGKMWRIDGIATGP